MQGGGTLVDVAGLQVGHYTDAAAATGCTVVLCERGARSAIDVRGAAPATRETDLLRPENTVQKVQAVLLTGGSAFGLAAAEGVVRYLEERGAGFPTGAGPVPIVPAASLFDLGIGMSAIRPGHDEGYSACREASQGPVAEGSVGAGTGASVGHLRGSSGSTKSGLGSASRRLISGATVGGLAVVNAFGDVVEPDTGRILAGARDLSGGFLDTTAHIEELAEVASAPRFGQHTTLALVATDSALERVELLRVAQMAHDGLARVIQPAHTGLDGDVVFALSTGSGPRLDPTIVGTIAAEILAESVLRAVTKATGLAGVPAILDLTGP
jgi:L-aminopeptidase/D-esterase-like protein